MPISEPMTLLTDWLLGGAVSVMAYRLVMRGRAAAEFCVSLWGAGFALSALAALAGGAYHGFGPALGETFSFILWKATVYAVGGAGCLMSLAIVRSVFTGHVRRWLATTLLLKFLLYVGWMTFHNDFLYVVADYAPDLLLILLLASWLHVRRRIPGALAIAGGVLLSFAAAAIQQGGFDLHRHFNHNDLYHVVQLAAFLLLYRGGLRMRDAR